MNFLSWLVVEKTFQFMWFKTDVKLITKLCFVGYCCHSVFIENLLIQFHVKNRAKLWLISYQFYMCLILNWYEKFKKSIQYHYLPGMAKKKDRLMIPGPLWYVQKLIQVSNTELNPKCISSFHFSWKALNLKCWILNKKPYWNFSFCVHFSSWTYVTINGWFNN